MIGRFNMIGMRTFKTGLAVIVTLLVSDLLALSNPFFAAIATIFAMESSISATFIAVRDRMYGTVLGAVVAFIFSMIMPVNALTVGIGIVIVIYLCNVFKWQGTIKISTVVFLAILLGFKEGGQFEYAFFRTMDTFIGLIISTLINYFVFPHNVGEKVNKSIVDIHVLINEMLFKIDKPNGALDLKLIARDLKLLEGDIDVMKHHFDILQKEIKISINTKYDMKMIQRTLETFNTIYHHLANLVTLYEDSEFDNQIAIKAYHIEKIKQFERAIPK